MKLIMQKTTTHSTALHFKATSKNNLGQLKFQDAQLNIISDGCVDVCWHCMKSGKAF